MGGLGDFDGSKDFQNAGCWDLHVSIVTATSADLYLKGIRLALISGSGTGKLVSTISYQQESCGPSALIGPLF